MPIGLRYFRAGHCRSSDIPPPKLCTMRFPDSRPLAVHGHHNQTPLRTHSRLARFPRAALSRLHPCESAAGRRRWSSGAAIMREGVDRGAGYRWLSSPQGRQRPQPGHTRQLQGLPRTQVDLCQLRPFDLMTKNDQLLTKKNIFNQQVGSTSVQISNRANSQRDGGLVHPTFDHLVNPIGK
jgi:hypothetical protein